MRPHRQQPTRLHHPWDSVIPNSLQPHGLQHARLPCPSPSISQSLFKLTSIQLMPFNHLILCCPLLLPPSIFPTIRVLSNESVLCIRWPKYWSFSFNISPSSGCSPSQESKQGLLHCRHILYQPSYQGSISKSRDITLPTKSIKSKLDMYGCERWAIKKAEHQRIDAFELWCWRRLLRVPWTAMRSNQSILKEISPEYSLEGLILKLKLWLPDAKN